MCICVSVGRSAPLSCEEEGEQPQLHKQAMDLSSVTSGSDSLRLPHLQKSSRKATTASPKSANREICQNLKTHLI